MSEDETTDNELAAYGINGGEDFKDLIAKIAGTSMASKFVVIVDGYSESGARVLTHFSSAETPLWEMVGMLRATEGRLDRVAAEWEFDAEYGED